MDDYEVVKVLNSGAFGVASLVVHKATKKKYVLKKIDISGLRSKQKVLAHTEMVLLRALKHPFIVRYKDSWEQGFDLCIVMQYAPGGDLRQKIVDRKGKPFTEDCILDWFTQISLALKHLHDRHVLHRDIKTRNIFLGGNGKRIKLGDFGLCKILDGSHMAHTKVGTAQYMAPELFLGKEYDYKADIWSLGCVLYEMMQLETPFPFENIKEVGIRVMKSDFKPLPANYSPKVKAICYGMLKLSPTERPTINALLNEPIVSVRVRNFISEDTYCKEFVLEPDALDLNPKDSTKQTEAPAVTTNSQTAAAATTTTTVAHATPSKQLPKKSPRIIASMQTPIKAAAVQSPLSPVQIQQQQQQPQQHHHHQQHDNAETNVDSSPSHHHLSQLPHELLPSIPAHPQSSAPHDTAVDNSPEQRIVPRSAVAGNGCTAARNISITRCASADTPDIMRQRRGSDNGDDMGLTGDALLFSKRKIKMLTLNQEKQEQTRREKETKEHLKERQRNESASRAKAAALLESRKLAERVQFARDARDREMDKVKKLIAQRQKSKQSQLLKEMATLHSNPPEFSFL